MRSSFNPLASIRWHYLEQKERLNTPRVHLLLGTNDRLMVQVPQRGSFAIRMTRDPRPDVGLPGEYDTASISNGGTAMVSRAG